MTVVGLGKLSQERGIVRSLQGISEQSGEDVKMEEVSGHNNVIKREMSRQEGDVKGGVQVIVPVGGCQNMMERSLDSAGGVTPGRRSYREREELQGEGGGGGRSTPAC